MYTIDKCYFCNTSLIIDYQGYSCNNKNCEYDYIVWDDGLISISVGDYKIQLNINNTTSIIPPNWNNEDYENNIVIVNHHLIVDKNFTVDEAENLYQKYKKLEMFK